MATAQPGRARDVACRLLPRRLSPRAELLADLRPARKLLILDFRLARQLAGLARSNSDKKSYPTLETLASVCGRGGVSGQAVGGAQSCRAQKPPITQKPQGNQGNLDRNVGAWQAWARV